MACLVICPYCETLAEFVDSVFIYGQSHGKVYWCPKCGAYVGGHKRTDGPLGTLANAELRTLSRKTHLIFDQLWKSGNKTRTEAYRWLSRRLGKEVEETHIALFTEDDCNKTIEHVIYTYHEIRRQFFGEDEGRATTAVGILSGNGGQEEDRQGSSR